MRQVMRMSVSSELVRLTGSRKDEGIINRKCTACKMKEEDDEDDDEKQLKISRKQSLNASKHISTEEITNEINNVRTSSGSSLDPSTKDFMELSFGYDFSKVRIRTGESAFRSAKNSLPGGPATSDNVNRPLPF
jgi:hypothetical protein